MGMGTDQQQHKKRIYVYVQVKNKIKNSFNIKFN